MDGRTEGSSLCDRQWLDHDRNSKIGGRNDFLTKSGIWIIRNAEELRFSLRKCKLKKKAIEGNVIDLPMLKEEVKIGWKLRRGSARFAHYPVLMPMTNEGSGEGTGLRLDWEEINVADSLQTQSNLRRLHLSVSHSHSQLQPDEDLRLTIPAGRWRLWIRESGRMIM